MRKSKYDKYVFIACLLVFLYSFFIIGCKPVYKSDIEYPARPIWWTDDDTGQVLAVEWSSAVLVAPMACIMFFFLMLFDDELLVVDRYWVKDNLKGMVKAFKEKMREGIREYREYRKGH